jgi:thiol-disulfide isomerase/thioredoxin
MKVLKFGAIWCSSCLIMKPRWQEIEKENPWLKTKYCDFDKDKSLIKKHKINKELPIFVFLNKNNKEFLRLTGEIPKKELIKVITANKNK